MNTGMYTALSGNVASQQRLEALTNNLANVNTAGYKKDRVIFESMLANVKNPSQGAGTPTEQTALSDVKLVTDYSAGSLRQSGNSLDVALEGEGFFVVNTPEGRGYTRQGNFSLNGGGQLVTAEGYPVVGNGGPVTIKGGAVVIDASGNISVDGNKVATLAMVDFPKPYPLTKAGNSVFKLDGSGAGEQPAKNIKVRQGCLEESNVNAIQEMAQLIETSRYYDSCVKAVQSYDTMMSKAANDLGKV